MECSDSLRALQTFMSEHKKGKHTKIYKVTITPRGKGVSHQELYQSFKRAIVSYKVVSGVFLIAERDNTNHFHGIITAKDNCKFLKMYSKRNPFGFHLSDAELYQWIKYMLKTQPTEFYNLPL